MTQFTKENLITEGKYLFYRAEGASYRDRKFVARFRTAGVGTFATHLRKNWTVEAYFAEMDAGKGPLTIAKQTGYMLPHIKRWLREGGYPVTPAGFEQMMREQAEQREQAL